jgi:predicted ester cyclase
VKYPRLAIDAHPAHGGRVTVQEMIMLPVAAGQIVEEWEVADLLGLLQQLGAVPPFRLDTAPV